MKPEFIELVFWKVSCLVMLLYYFRMIFAIRKNQDEIATGVHLTKSVLVVWSLFIISSSLIAILMLFPVDSFVQTVNLPNYMLRQNQYC